MVDRSLRFEAIHNFRHYGGYTVAGGGKLRDGWLYRSAHYGDATDSDRHALNDLQIAAVIDLHSPHERLKAASRHLPSAFAARVFETEVESGGLAPHIEIMVKGVTNAEEARKATQTVFVDLPYRPAVIAGLRNYFAALAETEGPSLIHCAAGKDRTGLAVALLHTSLGVHQDDVMADFLLTNTAGDFEKRLNAGIALVHENFGVRIGDEAARVLASVEPSYLEAAFSAIYERSGCVKSYLCNEIGVDPARQAQLEQRLVH